MIGFERNGAERLVPLFVLEHNEQQHRRARAATNTRMSENCSYQLQIIPSIQWKIAGPVVQMHAWSFGVFQVGLQGSCAFPAVNLHGFSHSNHRSAPHLHA